MFGNFSLQVNVQQFETGSEIKFVQCKLRHLFKEGSELK